MTDSSASDYLRRDYRTAFLRFLPQHDEAALVTAYSIGRAAVEGRTHLLDIVRVHHAVLAELIAGEPADTHPALIEAAADFLSEVLAPMYMAQGSITEE